jgi:hypothetical protein
MAINPDKLNEFLGKAIVDFGATFNAALIRIGDRLGLYKALAAAGPQTPAELAKKQGRPSAIFANGCPRKPRAVTSLMIPLMESFTLAKSKHLRWQMKTARRFFLGRSSWRWPR